MEKVSISLLSQFSKRTARVLPALFLLSLTGVTMFHVAPAAAARCNGPYSTGGTFIGDPWGNLWNEYETCPMQTYGTKYPVSAGVTVNSDGNPNTPTVGYKHTNDNWFVCWVKGARHSGGNQIWYYTQGEDWVGSYYSYGGWGFLPAVLLQTTYDPDSRVPQCPFSMGY